MRTTSDHYRRSRAGTWCSGDERQASGGLGSDSIHYPAEDVKPKLWDQNVNDRLKRHQRGGVYIAVPDSGDLTVAVIESRWKNRREKLMEGEMIPGGGRSRPARRSSAKGIASGWIGID